MAKRSTGEKEKIKEMKKLNGLIQKELDEEDTKINKIGELFSSSVSVSQNEIINIDEEISQQSIQKELAAIKDKHFGLYSTLMNVITEALGNSGLGMTDPKFLESINGLIKTANQTLSKVSEINLDILDLMVKHTMNDEGKENDNVEYVTTTEDIIKALREENRKN